MPTTAGMPVRNRFGGGFTADMRRDFRDDAIRERGYVVYADEDAEPPELPVVETDIEAEPVIREPRSAAAATAAIANAMGTTIDEATASGIDPAHEPVYNGSGGTRQSYADMDATSDPAGPPDPAPESRDSSRAYVVREGDWREDHGLPRRKKTVPPSRQPAARRLRHLRNLVELGKFPNVEAADRATQRRQSYGRPKAKARK